LSRILKAREVAEFRHRGDGDGALDTPQALEGVDHWGEPPGLDVVVQFLLQARKTGRVFGDRVHVFLKDNRLGRSGTDDLAEPAEVSRAPGGVARRADIVPQEKRFAPKLGRLEIMDSMTLLVNPLRPPLAVSLFSVKYYKKYLCILKQVRSPKLGNMVGRYGCMLLAQWMALRG
jgi:hypothetical protein